MAESMREIHLPDELCRNAEQKFGARFGSLDEFLTFLLQQVLRDDEAKMGGAEKRMIEERLKDLGYI
jgi:hypothetical protein